MKSLSYESWLQGHSFWPTVSTQPQSSQLPRLFILIDSAYLHEELLDILLLIIRLFFLISLLPSLMHVATHQCLTRLLLHWLSCMLLPLCHLLLLLPFFLLMKHGPLLFTTFLVPL